MDSVYVLIMIGAAIGLFIGYNKLKASSEGAYKRKPKRDFPDLWRKILEDKVAFYSRLSSVNRKKFEDKAHVFLLNVEIIGVDTEVTHEDRILVAAGAIIPVFKLKKWHYAGLHRVEIHPDHFLIPDHNKMANGLVGWGEMDGRMMLSRKALYAGFDNQSDHKNVAIHEFVHILDKQDGKIDGILKNVMSEADIKHWKKVINDSIDSIQNGDSNIRKYGKENPSEFLAVVSEYYFENPSAMRSEHPMIFNALESFYNPKNY